MDSTDKTWLRQVRTLLRNQIFLSALNLVVFCINYGVYRHLNFADCKMITHTKISDSTAILANQW